MPVNVPVYAAALVAFAVLVLLLSVYVLFALLISFTLMGLILALQAARLGPTPQSELAALGTPEAVSKRLSASRRRLLYDQLVSAVFIGVTWGIFVSLRAPYPRWLGPGITYSSSTAPSFPTADLAAWSAALVAASVLLGALWYRYVQRRASYDALHRRVLTVGSAEPVTAGAPGEPPSPPACQFGEAYRFSIAPTGPRPGTQPDVHSGDLVRLRLTGLEGALPQSFTLCSRHRAALAMLAVYQGIDVA